MVLRRAARVPRLFLIAGSFLTMSTIPKSLAQERPLHGDQSDAANRIPWPVYPHSGPSQFQAFPQPQPRFPQSILPPSFIKVINAVGSPDWETTTTTSSGAASSTTLTTTPSTTTTSTTTTQPPPVTSVALSSVEVRAPEVDPLSPSAWKAVQDQTQVPKRRRFQQIKRRRKPRPKEEDTKHFGENRNLGTQPPGTTAYPRTSRTTRRLPSTALIRGYRSKAPQVAPPTTTKRPFPRFPNGLKKFSPTPRWPTLTTSTTTTTTSTTSTRKPFIFGERRVPSWYGQTTPTTPRPPPTTTVPKLHRFGPNSNLRYKNDDLIKGPLARLRPPLRRSAIVRDAVPQTIEKDELELSQSIQTPNGRRRVTYTAPPRRHQAKNQHGQEQFPPHLMVNRTERGGQQGRSEPSDEVGEVVRFVAIPHFVGGTIPSRRADFREGGRAPLRRMYRPPFSMPGRRRFPFPGPVAVYPQSLASLEDSSQDEEAPIRIPVPRPAGPYPLLPPPPGLPIRVLRQPYSSNAGGPPTNVVQEQQPQQQQHPARTNPVPPAFPRPLGSLGNANLHGGRMNSKPEEPRCDRFSEDICLDDFEYPSAAILDTISRQRAKFDAMYAEVRDRSPQVEGVTRKEEERYTMHHYFGPDRDTRKDPRDYAQDGGFLCPSEILYERPRRARNHVGVWKVIINIAEYRQTMRLEKCLRPGRSCSYVLDKYSSSCNQVYSYQRLLTFEKGKGLHIDIFKVPSGCSCHVKGFSQYTRNDEYQPPYEYDKAIYSSASTPTSKESVEQRNSNISKTLWIILGNGKEIDQETKDRLVQQLKQYPQLAEQFPQADAIRQLINEAEETDYRRQPPRPDRRRQPYGPQYIKSKPKEEPAYHPTRPPPPQHWSQTSSTPDGPYYTSTSSFRRPPHAADFDGEEVLPHGARPRFYQRPFKSSEEDVLFTRSTGDTRIVVLRPRDPLSRRYHKPDRHHSSAGRPPPHAEQVDRISHGPSSRGDVLLVEPVRQRPYGKRFQVVTTTEPSTTRDVAKKINFSYHPIIDYITK